MKTGRMHESGFTLIEMLVAVAIFLAIGGAAISLYTSHVSLFNDQQRQSVLNFTLRNAAAQIQTDAAQAGDGYFQGTDIAAWPIGISVLPPVTGTCFNPVALTYSAPCFDTLNIITVDTSTPVLAAHPSNCAGADLLTDSSSNICLTPVAGTTVAQLISGYHKNDHVLLEKGDGSMMTDIQLTSNGTSVSGNTMAQFSFTKTTSGGGGTNPIGSTNDSFQDPNSNWHSLLISTAEDKTGGNGCPTTPARITNDFDSNSWALRLIPVVYTVDASNTSDPKLMRITPTSADVIAEQVIGFKVGTSSINNSDATYVYDATQPPLCGDYPQIRSVRVTIIARALQQNDRTINTFDMGPYKVESLSVIVSPRNLSMKDQGN